MCYYFHFNIGRVANAILSAELLRVLPRPMSCIGITESTRVHDGHSNDSSYFCVSIFHMIATGMQPNVTN